jgi:hypothetical protein
MRTKIALLAAGVALALPGAGAFASSLDCATDAAATVAAAQVVYVGNSWGPVPLYRVTLPTGSIDVHANSEQEARDIVSASLVAKCPVVTEPVEPVTEPAPAPEPEPAPTFDPNTEVGQILTAAAVTYLGDSWGPVPLYRVAVASLNVSVDVHANSPDEARAVAAPAVTAALEASRSAPSEPTPTETTETTSTSETPLTSSEPTSEPTTGSEPAPESTSTTSSGEPEKAVQRAPAPTRTITTTVSSDDADDALDDPDTESSNPLLSAALENALGREIVVTRATRCYRGPRPVRCATLYRDIEGRTVRVTLRGNKARKVIVFGGR